MSKTKILYVITKSNFGGAQRYVYELAAGLPKDLYDVTVAFGGEGLLKQKLEDAGIKTRAIKSFARDINLIKEVRSLFELAAILKEIRPDIVHLNSSKAGGSGALVARLMGVRTIVFTAHGWAFSEPRSFLWRSIVWILSWITGLLAHRVILVSHHDASQTHMPGVGQKCTVIHTALPHFTFVEHEAARAALFSQEERVQHRNDLWVVTTAELTPNKNLLSALAAVAHHNAHHTKKIFYSILGDGEQRAEIESFIRTHNIHDSVKLHGYVADARVYLKAFDVFLFPSHKEGLPYALLEAGCAELACVASNRGGIPEVITHRITGTLVNPNMPRDIESALAAYAENPTLRRAHGMVLREKILAEFTLEEMLRKTREIYDA